MQNKILGYVLDSTIWLESAECRLVYLTLLASMESDSIARFESSANLAARARLPMGAVGAALAALLLPSPHEARSSGPRLTPVSGGWRVNAGPELFALAARENTRQRVRRHRRYKGKCAKGRNKKMLQSVTDNCYTNHKNHWINKLKSYSQSNVNNFPPLPEKNSPPSHTLPFLEIKDKTSITDREYISNKIKPITEGFTPSVGAPGRTAPEGDVPLSPHDIDPLNSPFTSPPQPHSQPIKIDLETPNTPPQATLSVPENKAPGKAIKTPKPAKTEKVPRPRNPLFDALAESTEGVPPGGTASNGPRIAAALALIRAASPDVTSDDIRARARRYLDLMPAGTMLTCTALAAHWHRCDPSGSTRLPRHLQAGF